MSGSSVLISVIIPVYNVEKYLRECLDSVLAQTCSDYEVIMVDDGSTDSSGKICDEYTEKDSRFRVIHQQNGGLSVARNAGLDASLGEYIYFLDSDDRIAETLLAKTSAMIQKTSADFVFFDGRSFEDSEKGYDVRQGYIRKRDYGVDSGICMFDALQKGKDFKSAVPTYLWKKSFLTENRLRFYPCILYEDMIFSFEAFCRAQIATHCHEQLYHRRLRAGSIMKAGVAERNFVSACIVYREIVRIAKESGYAERLSVKQYVARCSLRLIEIYSKLSMKDKRKCRKNYSAILHEIRNLKGYESKALFYRTYGRLPWAAYKAFEKLHGENG